jgi:hypothetical protein
MLEQKTIVDQEDIMKRLLKGFMILCTIAIVQIWGGSIVKALPAVDYSASYINTQESKQQFPIPMLVKLEQISPNQIQISYDRDADVKLATKATNYWVQDTVNISPKGIATLGKNDKVSNANSLTDRMVKIESKDGLANTYILTFSKNITKGAEYKLIICYVTVEGAPPYAGDNGTATFVGK